MALLEFGFIGCGNGVGVCGGAVRTSRRRRVDVGCRRLLGGRVGIRLDFLLCGYEAFVGGSGVLLGGNLEGQGDVLGKEAHFVVADLEGHLCLHRQGAWAGDRSLLDEACFLLKVGQLHVELLAELLVGLGFAPFALQGQARVCSKGEGGRNGAILARTARIHVPVALNRGIGYELHAAVIGALHGGFPADGLNNLAQKSLRKCGQNGQHRNAKECLHTYKNSP